MTAPRDPVTGAKMDGRMLAALDGAAQLFDWLHYDAARRELVAVLECLDRCGGRSTWTFYVTQVAEAALLFLRRYAPFQVGDRIVIATEVPVARGSGWWPVRDKLALGAAGTVHRVGSVRSRLVYDVVLDSDPDHTYALPAEWLARPPGGGHGGEDDGCKEANHGRGAADD